ncbi:hypothetical protein LshimejAT787_0100680 [Lyophyllum shimeji]|uniref:URB1 N-terminal domain-containing protein n=1 Tax=Lyophyllum shimeji TaxID=47721 RepID=A0A9P3PD01_LYOSH|nr:hypothetical protein LshimejAT787_0100680 [Lyophyllum shimeji]
MPAKSVKKATPAAAKRQKIDHEKPTRGFTSVEEISAALRSQNQEILVENLTALRNRLSIRPGENAISPQDERLLLAQRWMENVPGAHDIFGVWDSLTQRQNSIYALLVSILSSLLALLSSHYTFQALGQPIMKTLLTPTYMRRLNSYLGGTHAEEEVGPGVVWLGAQVALKLLNMRRKSKAEDASDALTKPDIRTFYILFMLSFVAPTLLRKSRRHPYPVVRKVLEVCWTGIWSDPKVKRTLKIGLFNEITISHLLKLYERVQPEGDDPDQIPADLVHHFLLASAPAPGLILANILKTLKVNEDPRQQELALKIMSACPELVSGFWAGAALTLEPRLSSKWIANIAFFARAATALQYLGKHLSLRQHEGSLFEGLQSPSGLVQHCTAIALSKCLAKYEEVLAVFRDVETSLEENEADGHGVKDGAMSKGSSGRPCPCYSRCPCCSAEPHTRGAPCGECGQAPVDVSSLFTDGVAEARFDVGKLLQNFSIEEEKVKAQEVSASDAATRLRRAPTSRSSIVEGQRSVCVVWENGLDIAKLPRSPTESVHGIRKPCNAHSPRAAPPTHPLGQHHVPGRPDRTAALADLPPDLAACPRTESPDGAPLTDERGGVIAFLDDCVQRCMKTPIGTSRTSIRSRMPTRRPRRRGQIRCPAQPLLMTVLEQLEVKVAKRLLTASDVLALASFFRKLVFRLAGKQQDLAFLNVVAASWMRCFTSSGCSLSSLLFRLRFDAK